MDGKIVEAIEDGKIVNVSEDYARREGLLILRRKEFAKNRGLPSEVKKRIEDEGNVYGIRDLRKPMGWEKNRVHDELVDNFHWAISKERKKRNMTRKQFAEKIGESERSVKLLENGILPSDDFILVNKVQEFLGINLRKDNQDFSQPIRKQIEGEDKDSEEEIFGDEIDLADELD